MKIAIEKLGDSGVWYHRQYIPHKGMDVVWFNPGEPVPRGCDIVVKSASTRPLSFPADYNPVVIVDVDDYWSPPKHHLLYGSSRVYNWREIRKANFDNADLITCSTDELAEKITPLRIYNYTDVEVLPNFIDRTEKQFEVNRQKQPLFTFGYVGGSTHEHDVRVIRHAIKMLHAQRPGEFMFLYAGYDTRVEIRDTAGNIIPNAPNPHDAVVNMLRANPVVPARLVTNYAPVYNFIDCAIAPLEDHTFNRCKSDLKYIEAAAFGVPCIASDLPEFSKHDHIVTCRNSVDWLNAFNAAIDGKLNAMGEQAKHSTDVAESLRNERVKLYESLL